MPTVKSGPEAPEYRARTVRRTFEDCNLDGDKATAWLLAMVLMEAVPIERGVGRTRLEVAEETIKVPPEDDDVPRLLLPETAGEDTKCLFLPKELVCAHTFNESSGWPKTTPTTPAAYPAIALFRADWKFTVAHSADVG